MTHLNRGRVPAAAALCAGVSLLLIAPALAQDSTETPGDPPQLFAIEAGDDSYVLLRDDERPNEVTVTVGTEPADVSAAVEIGRSDLDVQTMIVIDNSVHVDEILDDFISAATNYVARAPSNESIGVYTTGGGGRLRLGLNRNHDRTIEAIEGVVASTDESHLWDGIRGAALDLGSGEAGRTNLIVLAGSADSTSASSIAATRGSVLAANATLLVVAHENPGVPLDSLSNMASVSNGGRMSTTPDPTLIAGYGTSVSDLVGGTYVIPFRSDVLADNRSITITVDGARIDATYVAATLTAGAALDPVVPSGSGGLPFLQGDTARTLGVIFGAIAAGLGAWGIALMFQKDQSGLNNVLQAYSDPYGSGGGEEEQESGLARNTIVKRAVEITESLAERQGMLVRAEHALERADLPLRAAEALTAYAGIVFACLVVGLLLSGSPLMALIFGAIGAMIPPAVINFLANRRKKAFLSQLPDTLQLLSSTLKAGYSFMQGVEAVSQEVEDPMGEELRRVVTEAQLGRPLEEALDASAERMDSPDFAWAVMAVKIQREVGGNLSELLLTVSETMTARERLRRDVAALTAEGKMSAIVLGALPILLGFAMYVMNPEYIGTLFEESLGKILLVASMVSALIGFAWMKKIIDIDI